MLHQSDFYLISPVLVLNIFKIQFSIRSGNSILKICPPLHSMSNSIKTFYNLNWIEYTCKLSWSQSWSSIQEKIFIFSHNLLQKFNINRPDKTRLHILICVTIFSKIWSECKKQPILFNTSISVWSFCNKHLKCWCLNQNFSNSSAN